ncbi:hypothetical protein K1719_036385 [Acacia pycnantha]|nr:hypothetical protein K1719_036385 [Acacia pycnantha]
MREMNEIESLELLSWHAFKQEAPFENFINLSKNVVAYCGGLPLALEILGSCLCGRTTEEWEDVLSKLQRIPNKDVHAKLQISYDGLNDYMEKDIFLDICCFFINKDKNYVTQILDGCGFHIKNGLQILIERSLIKVGRNNKFEMYDLLQEMGKEIICESAPKNLGERSRFWFHEDVLDVMTEHTLLEKLKTLNLSHSSYLTQTPDFTKLPNLEMLVLKDCPSLMLVHRALEIRKEFI